MSDKTEIEVIRDARIMMPRFTPPPQRVRLGETAKQAVENQGLGGRLQNRRMPEAVACTGN